MIFQAPNPPLSLVLPAASRRMRTLPPVSASLPTADMTPVPVPSAFSILVSRAGAPGLGGVAAQVPPPIAQATFGDLNALTFSPGRNLAIPGIMRRGVGSSG